LALAATGEEEPWVKNESFGARYGFSAFGRTKHFEEADVFAEWSLPYALDLGNDYTVQAKISGSGGLLKHDQNDAGIFMGGPELFISKKNLPLSLEGGVVPAFISREDYGNIRVGGFVQFSTHLVVGWDVTRHVRLFYRFQHLSNGGLRSPNPGLNFHMFGASYVF
jgi:hypothetical protein